MIFIIIGVAGAGKSLQSKLLSESQGWKWLATGNHLRALLGSSTKEKLVKGVLLPDNTVLPLIEGYLNNLEDKEHCILDGFPRTESQARWLINYASKNPSQPIAAVVHLVASKPVAKDRLIKRARPDDHEEAIQKRFAEYDERISPLIKLFKAEPSIKVLEVDAERPVQEVFADINSKLANITRE